VHADTTPANVHEAMRTAPIHEALVQNSVLWALAERGLSV
jgi:hypothetical protein